MEDETSDAARPCPFHSLRRASNRSKGASDAIGQCTTRRGIFRRGPGKSRAFYEALGFKVTHTEKTFLELQWSDGHKLFISESKDAGTVPEKPVINIRIGVEKVDDHWKGERRRN